MIWISRRGEAGPGGAVDGVVDIEPGRAFSTIDNGSLRVVLGDIIGRETDVVVRPRRQTGFREGIAESGPRIFC